MKYATLLLGLALVIANVAIARAEEEPFSYEACVAHGGTKDHCANLAWNQAPWAPMTSFQRAQCVREEIALGVEPAIAKRRCNPNAWAKPPALGWVCGDWKIVRKPGGLKDKRDLFCD
jgi:hypothetical protein